MAADPGPGRGTAGRTPGLPVVTESHLLEAVVDFAVVRGWLVRSRPPRERRRRPQMTFLPDQPESARQIRELLTEVVELAASSGLWTWGDGAGGWVVSILAGAAAKAGLPLSHGLLTTVESGRP